MVVTCTINKVTCIRSLNELLRFSGVLLRASSDIPPNYIPCIFLSAEKQRMKSWDYAGPQSIQVVQGPPPASGFHDDVLIYVYHNNLLWVLRGFGMRDITILQTLEGSIVTKFWWDQNSERSITEIKKWELSDSSKFLTKKWEGSISETTPVRHIRHTRPVTHEVFSWCT